MSCFVITDSALLPWLQSHDISIELEISTLYCTHAESKIPVSEFTGKKHFWKHVAYCNMLMLKVGVLFDLI